MDAATVQLQLFFVRIRWAVVGGHLLIDLIFEDGAMQAFIDAYKEEPGNPKYAFKVGGEMRQRVYHFSWSVVSVLSNIWRLLPQMVLAIIYSKRYRNLYMWSSALTCHDRYKLSQDLVWCFKIGDTLKKFRMLIFSHLISTAKRCHLFDALCDVCKTASTSERHRSFLAGEACRCLWCK